MKLNVFVCGLSLLGTVAFAQKNEWQDPNINEINRAPMHTYYFAYEDEASAQKGCKESSSNYMTLNGTWKFFWVKDADMRPTDFYQVGYNDKGWDNMQVPGLWEMNGYGDPQYVNVGYPWREQYKNNPPIVPTEGNHVGSYRKEITIPAGWKGKEIFAHFGSVTSNMYLWVNGKFVGYSEDSKLEAEFNLTKYLKPGKNLIAFQVFRWCDGSYLEDQDFMRLAGVGRNCYLYAREKRRIEDIRITPDLDAAYQNGTLTIDVKLKGSGQVQLKLKDAQGSEVASTTTRGETVTMQVSNPKKWTAETPYLYTLYAQLSESSSEIIPIKVGFRKIELKNSQIWVNGKPVLFKGANRHEVDPDYGYAARPERMIQDIQRMKELNINAVRTCHYPDDNLWYDLCDQYGIYMVAEANVESHGMGYGEQTLAKNPSYAKAHMERNQRNVQRNFNHPSIIFWSLGNEAGFGPNFEACYKWIKNEDPSRAVQYEQAGTNEFTDIYCPMYRDYKGCEEYCKGDIDKPLIQCEYAHAMGNSQGGFKEYWDLVRKYPKFQGGFIWDFVDQSLHAWTQEGIPYYAYGGDWNKYDASDNNFFDNGLINPDRIPHPHAYEVQQIYQSIWVTPSDLANGVVNVYNEYFFRDLSNYYAEWQLLADGEILQTGTIEKLDVAPQETKAIKLGYNTTDICKDKELLLNIHFKLKTAETLLPAGYCVAKSQLTLRPYKMPELILANETENNIETALPVLKENDNNYLIVEGERFRLDFSRRDGFLCRYEADGMTLLKEDGKLTPNFWRAPTDNDMGANLQNRYVAWKEPGLKLTSLDGSLENGLVVVKAAYTMENVKAQLFLTYTINNKGTIKVTQKMVADKSAKVSDMFRFGMQMQMPKCMDRINYYGRGPIENYADRNNFTDLGHYRQTVDEQFHPYIRPQETGTKTDIRWWKQTDISGNGLLFISDAPFSASALHYSIESLDDGTQKDQRHSELVPQVNYTNMCIDKAQMGLGCINSWGALPIEKYRLPYGDYEFSFIMKPIQGNF